MVAPRIAVRADTPRPTAVVALGAEALASDSRRVPARPPHNVYLSGAAPPTRVRCRCAARVPAKMAASLRKVDDREIYETGPPQRPCDPLLFFEALLPIDSKAASAPAKRTASGSTSHKPTYCMANVLDTITALNGEPRVWVFTQHDGSITQKKHYDRATVMTSWRQHCASPSVEWREGRPSATAVQGMPAGRLLHCLAATVALGCLGTAAMRCYRQPDHHHLVPPLRCPYTPPVLQRCPSRPTTPSCAPSSGARTARWTC